MNHQSPSPNKLKTTESILTSLYDRMIRKNEGQVDCQFTDVKKYSNGDQLNGIRNHTSFECHPRFLSEVVEVNDSPKIMLGEKSIKHDFEKDEHIHTHSCCILSNPKIRGALEKGGKDQYLLQTYKEEVEYLKKLNFFQSQEIQKLRKMLRVQRERQFSEKQRLGVMFSSHQLDSLTHVEQKQRKAPTRKNSRVSQKKESKRKCSGLSHI